MAPVPLPSVVALIESFERSLLARNLAPRTIYGYTDAARRFHDDCDKPVEQVTRDDIRAHLANLSQARAPSTVGIRYRSLQQWFKWLHEEDEIDTNPMVAVAPPKVPEQPVAIVPVEDLRRLLKTCSGKDFASRRDAAILRLFLDGGIRLDEMAGITVDDVDLRGQTVTVLGKGRRERSIPFGVKTGAAIDRYVRVRVRHPKADEPGLWLGAKGKGTLTGNGIYQMVKRRAAEVGIELHPHQFRHTMAHEWLDNGGNEGDLMAIAGWRSRSMLQRYGSAAAASRARRAHRQNSLGDRL